MNINQDSLRRLADLYGIEGAYYDIWGNLHRTSAETELKLLSAMGVEVSPGDGVEEIIHRREEEIWSAILEPVKVYSERDEHPVFVLRLPEEETSAAWTLAEENGRTHQGNISLAGLRETGRCVCRGANIVRYETGIPVRLPAGYHTLTVKAPMSGEQSSMRIAVCPAHCWLPEAIEHDRKKLWGIVVQLYSLRSRHNWGIGDFSDLKGVIDVAAKMGASFVGTSPLHALFPKDPTLISPYSPSTRQALNVLFIDAENVDEFRESEHVREFAAGLMQHRPIEGLREPEFVDYDTVISVKLRIFEELYRHFKANHLQKETLRGRAFRKFVEEGGEDLKGTALYEALDEYFKAQHSAIWGWPVWPDAYRDPSSEAVRDFAATHNDRIEYYQYLQWLAVLQLNEAGERAQANGMEVGLYLDVALGVNSSGSEAWFDQRCYAFKASAGAPPDLLNVKGQVWGLPPLIPHRLREEGYDPFVRALRYNMRYSGAIRIDHVMQLMRLFWVPEGETGEKGAYVRYFVDDLMNIVALESQRNKCLVIGEDLGTVPDEVRHGMQARSLLSYKVLYFMKDYNNGRFFRPDEYPERALVTASTHDLPTIAGFWKSEDLEVRRHLNLFTEHVTYGGETKGRVNDVRAILHVLKEAGLIPESFPIEDPEIQSRFTPELCLAVHLALAKSNCALQAIQLEDMLLQVGQMNLPGTTREHPNWKRRLAMSLEDIAMDTRLFDFGRRIAEARRS